jgi:hypothetical protein
MVESIWRAQLTNEEEVAAEHERRRRTQLTNEEEVAAEHERRRRRRRM